MYYDNWYVRKFKVYINFCKLFNVWEDILKLKFKVFFLIIVVDCIFLNMIEIFVSIGEFIFFGDIINYYY